MNPQPAADSKQDGSYRVECFRSAREELLFRVKHRDSYLNIHFLVQGVLLALSKGVKIAGVETSSPLALSLYLAVPLTAVFALLYYTEDRLIGQLSSYAGSLSGPVQKEFSEKVVCWDVSPQLREYARTTVWYRFLAHLAAFVIAPSVLLYLLYHSAPPTTCHQWIGCTSQIIILVCLLALSIKELRYRLTTGREWKTQAEQNDAPNEDSARAPSS